MPETIFEKQGAKLTVKPSGRLDTATSPLLEQAVRQHMDGITDITMDFADVNYISSGGLRMLLAIEQTMEDRGGEITVIHANEYIIDVFELVGFMEVVNVVQD